MKPLLTKNVVTAIGIAANVILIGATATAGVPDSAGIMAPQVPFLIAPSTEAASRPDFLVETVLAKKPGNPDCLCLAQSASYCWLTGNGPYFPMGHKIDSYLHLCSLEAGSDR